MKRILVIDDKDDVRSFVSTALANFGFSISQARDGEIALRQIIESKPNLILCDVTMPGMDGFEILSAVRASSRTAAIPFILMSGLPDPDAFRRAMVAGADDFLVKPFTTDDLADAVMSRLVRHVDFQVEAEERLRERVEVAHAIPEFATALGV